jgi:hypothetical protein
MQVQFFPQRSKDPMVYRFMRADDIIFNGDTQLRADWICDGDCHLGYVTGNRHPRSRLYAYRFYLSPLMAHTAPCRTGYVTGERHPRTRL